LYDMQTDFSDAVTLYDCDIGTGVDKYMCYHLPKSLQETELWISENVHIDGSQSDHSYIQ
jgi:hypothetical protein